MVKNNKKYKEIQKIVDRTFKGLIAGMIGTIPMNTINLILYSLKLTKLRFIDWASLIMTGSLPNDLNSIIYSLFIQILWSGALGIGLAFLYPMITSKGYFIKATLYSFALGFLFRGIVVLFQVPDLYKVTTLTSEMNFISVVSWGLTAAFFLHKFDNK